MAIPFAKLTIIIGAGLVGSALTKEGRLSDLTGFFSGALKIVTKHLHQDKDNIPPCKVRTDNLLAQVNTIQEELQFLASSRSVTIVNNSGSGSGKYGVTAVILVGVVGYGYIWWKGWKLQDLMFVTRRSFSDSCNVVGKQVDVVSESLSSARRHISSRIDHVDNNVEECIGLAVATKDKVTELHGDLSVFGVDIDSIHRAVETLEIKLERIEEAQDLATQGVYKLCKFVHGEQSRNKEHLEASPSCSLPAQTLPVTRAGPFPALALEPSNSPLFESSKVLRSSSTLSASALKDLHGISNALNARNSRPSASSAASSGTPITQEPANSSSSSGLFRWKLPSINVLSRKQSTS